MQQPHNLQIEKKKIGKVAIKINAKKRLLRSPSVHFTNSSIILANNVVGFFFNFFLLRTYKKEKRDEICRLQSAW